MDKFRFLKWKVYQDSKRLFSMILKIVAKLPREYRFELGSQMIRSALSVMLNIAEGSGKASDKELNRFFNISLGSLNETLAAVDCLYYSGLLPKDDFDSVFMEVENISNQLGGFKKKLSKQIAS